jgi:hypothetical protein
MALLAMSLLCAFGCRKASVEAYRIPKEKDPEIAAASAPAASGSNATAPSANGGSSMANTAVPTAEGAGLTWTAPAEWRQKPASAMRKGSFTIPGNGGEDGDLSITAFPGDVGGELANVNRWRGQVQLPPVTEADLASEVTRAEHDGLKFAIVDFTATGSNPHRILGAIVPFEGATWFFKLAGPDAVVGGAKTSFIAFLQTVKPAATP